MNAHTYSHPCCQVVEMSLFCNCHVSEHIWDTGQIIQARALQKEGYSEQGQVQWPLFPVSLSVCVESSQRLDRIGNLSLNTQIPSLNPIKTNTHFHTHIQILSQCCLMLSLRDLIQITQRKVRVLIWMLSSASFKYTRKHTHTLL